MCKREICDGVEERELGKLENVTSHGGSQPAHSDNFLSFSQLSAPPTSRRNHLCSCVYFVHFFFLALYYGGQKQHVLLRPHIKRLQVLLLWPNEMMMKIWETYLRPKKRLGYLLDSISVHKVVWMHFCQHGIALPIVSSQGAIVSKSFGHLWQ